MDFRVLIAAPLAALMLATSAAEPTLPAGWEARKSAVSATRTFFGSADYEIGLDPDDKAAGSRSLRIRSVGSMHPEWQSFGAAQQLAWGYGGKRVRLSGQVRSEDLSGWAGLYIGAGDETLLSSVANGAPGVEQRLPVGATAEAAGLGWQDVSVVFDVPADALSINLGLALVGEGQVWARGMQFAVVGVDVPATTAPIGIDWARGRKAAKNDHKAMLAAPPQQLFNASFD